MKKQKKLNFESFSLATRDFCQTWTISNFGLWVNPKRLRNDFYFSVSIRQNDRIARNER
jgi:hypothetical protein